MKWEVRDLSGLCAGGRPAGFLRLCDAVPTEQVSDCLCVWDIDRTLTAKQGMHNQCPGTKHHPDIKDFAYTGGTLVLSELAQNINQTFCGQCYFAIISAESQSRDVSKTKCRESHCDMMCCVFVCVCLFLLSVPS